MYETVVWIQWILGYYEGSVFCTHVCEWAVAFIGQDKIESASEVVAEVTFSTGCPGCGGLCLRGIRGNKMEADYRKRLWQRKSRALLCLCRTWCLHHLLLNQPQSESEVQSAACFCNLLSNSILLSEDEWPSRSSAKNLRSSSVANTFSGSALDVNNVS